MTSTRNLLSADCPFYRPIVLVPREAATNPHSQQTASFRKLEHPRSQSRISKRTAPPSNMILQPRLASSVFSKGVSHRTTCASRQQWDCITNPTHAVAKDRAVEGLLEYFGMLSVDRIDINAFAQPVSDATPMERFLADIPSGINRRLLDRPS